MASIRGWLPCHHRINNFSTSVVASAALPSICLFFAESFFKSLLYFFPLANSLLIISMHTSSRSVTILWGTINNLQLKYSIECSLLLYRDSPVCHTTSLYLQLSSPLPWWLWRSLKYGVYSRVATILLRSSLNVVSIWRWPPNKVWRLFKHLTLCKRISSNLITIIRNSCVDRKNIGNKVAFIALFMSFLYVQTIYMYVDSYCFNWCFINQLKWS